MTKNNKDHVNYVIQTKICILCNTKFVEYYEHFDACECGECMEVEE